MPLLPGPSPTLMAPPQLAKLPEKLDPETVAVPVPPVPTPMPMAPPLLPSLSVKFEPLTVSVPPALSLIPAGPVVSWSRPRWSLRRW